MAANSCHGCADSGRESSNSPRRREDSVRPGRVARRTWRRDFVHVGRHHQAKWPQTSQNRLRLPQRRERSPLPQSEVTARPHAPEDRRTTRRSALGAPVAAPRETSVAGRDRRDGKAPPPPPWRRQGRRRPDGARAAERDSSTSPTPRPHDSPAARIVPPSRANGPNAPSARSAPATPRPPKAARASSRRRPRP